MNVNLLSENTKAPYFNLRPGFTDYQYQVKEGAEVSVLDRFDVSVDFI